MSKLNKDTINICKNEFNKTKSLPPFKGVIERVIRDVAEEHKLTLTEVRLIVASTFGFTKKILDRSVREPISEDNFVNVRWKYFGSFQKATHRARIYLERLKNFKERNNA